MVRNGYRKGLCEMETDVGCSGNSKKEHARLSEVAGRKKMEGGRYTQVGKSR